MFDKKNLGSCLGGVDVSGTDTGFVTYLCSTATKLNFQKYCLFSEFCNWIIKKSQTGFTKAKTNSKQWKLKHFHTLMQEKAMAEVLKEPGVSERQMFKRSVSQGA